jgi:hypothetical protein
VTVSVAYWAFPKIIAPEGCMTLGSCVASLRKVLFALVSVIIAAVSKWTPIGVAIDAVLLPVSTYCWRSAMALGRPVEHV